MNRKLLLALLLTMPLTYGCAQLGSGYSLDFSLSKTDFADTIAIEYQNAQVYVPVTINGQPYRFLLDTGSGHAVVYDDRRFENSEPAGTIATRDAIGHRDTVEMVSLPPLTLGSLTLTGCRATVQHRAVKRPGVDGILGFDLVCKGMQMKIDTREKILILTDKRKFFDQEEGFEMKYKLDYHVPFLQVKPFKGYQEQALFDTGSRHLYSMNKASFDRGERACLAQNNRQIEGRTMGRHAMGLLGSEPLGEVVFLCLDSLSLGGFSFGDLHVVTTQGGSHVGARLLEYGSVAFLPKRKRMLFQPFDGSSRSLVGNEQLQKAIVNEDGLPVVGLVWERSELFAAGLRQGDIILMADDHAFSSFADFMAFRPLIGKVYHVMVRDRRGFVKEVKMTMARSLP